MSLWIDQGGIDAVLLWSEQIVTALESVKVLRLMVTESAVHSHDVAKEVVLVSERTSTAFHRTARRAPGGRWTNRSIIPWRSSCQRPSSGRPAASRRPFAAKLLPMSPV